MSEERQARMLTKMNRDIDARSRGSFRLTRISKHANQLHRRICRKQRDMLRYARNCGRLLTEAFAVKKHGTWKKWVHDNLDFSYETSRDYRQVAKEWNSPAAKEARKKGVHFGGIRPFLDFVKDRRINPEKKILTPKQQKEFDYSHDAIRDMVMERIKELDDFEFKILYKNFEHFWSKLDDELKAILRVVYEYDPYEWDEAEQYELKKQAREIVGRRMNRNRKS